jgi:Flp pilus assembly protein TadG
MLLARFWRNRDGGIAPMLALAALPLFGFVGASVDFGRAAGVRTAMLSALDATALALSRDAPTTDPNALGPRADALFRALFNHPDAQNVQITHEFTKPQDGNFSLKITGSGSVTPMFTKLLGQSVINFSASTEVLWGIKKLELALVLDNTGSMASNGKMTALKTAAKNLLTTLQNAAKEPGDIKVAIVPFATDVNVGAKYKNETWIDWTDWEAENGTCSSSSYSKKSTCVSNGKIWTPKDHSVWNGCVNDRDQHNDAADTAPISGSPSTLFRAHQASNCPVAMMPLNFDWTALNGKIDAMTPTGNTNTTIGLAWGFQHLTTNAPFAAAAPRPDLDKVIIMLTDGTNTQNRWTSSSSSIDSRTVKACDNIKAQNIKLYTVRVIDGNASLLRGCATKPEMFYDVDEAVELNVVFSSIAQNLANLRITK